MKYRLSAVVVATLLASASAVAEEPADGSEAPQEAEEASGEMAAAGWIGARAGARGMQRAAIGPAGFVGMFEMGQAAVTSTYDTIEQIERARADERLRLQISDFSRTAVENALAASRAEAVRASADREKVQEDESYFVRTRLVDPERLARTGGAAHRFGEADLEALEYDDPTAILLQVPGVAVRKEDGFGLRPNIGIRGASAERSKKITLMEDGILFGPAPYAAPAAYYFPIVSRMVGIEVFKGPSSVRYGPHTIGGAVNWISRGIPADPSAGVDASIGRFATAKAHGWFGTSNEWGGFLLEGVRWQSDGFKELDDGGSTGFEKNEFMAKGRLNTDPAAHVYHALQLKLGYSTETSHETYLGLSDEDFAEDPYRRYPASALGLMDWWRTQVELRHTLEIGQTVVIENVAYRHDFERAWRKLNRFAAQTSLEAILEDPTGRRAIFYDILRGEEDSSAPDETLLIGTNDRRFVSQGLQSIADWRVKGDGWANALEGGVRFHFDSIERLHTEEPYLMQAGELVRGSGETTVTTDNRGEAFAFAAHVLDQFDYGDVSLSPGLRVEHVITNFSAGDVDTSNDQTVLIPGFGAYWEFFPTIGVLAGVHRGFSPVSPGQDDRIEPETSVNYEAGLRHFDSETGQLFEVVGFFSDYGNLTGECTFSAGCDEADVDEQFNAGEVNVYGVEVVGATSIALAGSWRMPLRLTYTFTETEFLSSFSSSNPQFGEVEAGDELPYVPTHQGSLRVGAQNHLGGVTAAATYVGEMREEASQGEEGRKTERYLVIDVLGSVELLGPFDVYVQLQNIANAKPIASRRPYGARPIRPVTAALGIRGEF